MGSREGVEIEDVPVQEVWARLGACRDSVLIDVRTRAEWTFVGLPDLDRLGKRVFTVEWQSFPGNQTDPLFVSRLCQALESAGVKKDAELFFICRSGGRSRMAAEIMRAAGYKRCYNVADGFEGPLNGSRQRGQVAGWKAAGLPWVQG